MIYEEYRKCGTISSDQQGSAKVPETEDTKYFSIFLRTQDNIGKPNPMM
jgi:hypothetical protein